MLNRLLLIALDTLMLAAITLLAYALPAVIEGVLL